MLRSKCKNKNCKTLVDAPLSQYCPDCWIAKQRGRKRQRDPAHARVYNSAAWRKTRRSILESYPVCGCCWRKPAKVVDHIIPLRAVLNDPCNTDNLIALCKSCHDKITLMEQNWYRQRLNSSSIGIRKRKFYAEKSKLSIARSILK